MLGFDLQISGVGGDRLANCPTTMAQTDKLCQSGIVS